VARFFFGEAEMAKYFSIILLLLALGGCDGPRTWPVEKFDAAVWRAAPEQERYKFVQDLIASGRLNGKSMSQVIELLGPPSFESKLPNLTYVVITGSKGFDQGYMLDIHFADGKVRNIMIRGG
jgi:hypothetical protein